MLGRGIHLFKLAGFAIRIDWSWPILAVLVIWSLATGVFPYWVEGAPAFTYWVMGASGAAGLFASIVLHELGHALIARRYGVEMRGITLFIFGGVAEMRDEPPNSPAEFAIAIAGPLVSVVIGVASLASGWLLDTLGNHPEAPAVLYYLGIINLVLVGFNLIPAFPLDGGRVLRAALWKWKEDLKWATRVTSTIGTAFGVGLIVLGVASFLTGNVVGGVWWFILGMFLRNAAQMSYQQILVRRALEGEPISRFMSTDIETVDSRTSVDQFVSNYVYRHYHKMYPVTDGSILRGCLSLDRIRDLPPEEWPHHTVAEFSAPCSEANTVSPETDATVALARMSQPGHSKLLVVDHGRLRGIVSMRDIARFISMKMDMEGSTV